MEKPVYWSEKIPYIKKLKEFYSKINYKEINLWPIMANDVYTYYKNQEQRTKKEIFMETLKNFFLIDNLKINGKSKKIFATYFMARKDHHEFFLKAISDFKKNEISVLDFYEEKVKNPLLRSRIIFPDIFLFFKIFIKYRGAKLKKILGKHYWLFISKLYHRYKQINQFGRIYMKYSPKAYISFCSSAFPEEAIFTLLCKKNNIPSFNLQHGFYSPPKKEFFPIAVQNENAISKYHLVWGENSKKSMEEYLKGKSEIIVAGNPKYSIQDNGSKKINLRTITFFFSVTSYEENNKKVVKILNEFAKKNPEIKIKLKIHPFDKIENYTSIVTEKNIVFEEKDIPISKLLKESDLIITHYTTIELEALLYGKAILRFKDDKSLPFWESNEDRFSNLKEFEDKLKKIKSQKEFQKRMNFYKKELLKNFYFEDKKSVPEVYREKILEKI